MVGDVLCCCLSQPGNCSSGAEQRFSDDIYSVDNSGSLGVQHAKIDISRGGGVLPLARARLDFSFNLRMLSPLRGVNEVSAAVEWQ